MATSYRARYKPKAPPSQRCVLTIYSSRVGYGGGRKAVATIYAATWDELMARAVWLWAWRCGAV